MVEENRLYGIGIGYVDAQLIASVAMASGATLWSRDRRMNAVATTLGVRHTPELAPPIPLQDDIDGTSP